MVDVPMIFTVENGIYKGQITHDLNKYNCLGNVIWSSIKRNGEKIAHLDVRTEETVTYAELQDKVVRCALWLQKQGVKSNDIISVCTGNHCNSIVPCLSAIYTNVIFNPWDENMNLKTALHVLRMIMPKVIFCSEKSIDVILSAIKEQNCSPTIVIFGKHVDAISFSDILSNCSNVEIANFHYVDHVDITKTACILHSSGTSGMPKGVELSNRVLLYICQNKSIDSTNEIFLWFSSLYWVTGIFLNLITIEQGRKVIICPEFNEEMTCQLIEKYQVEFLFLSTSLLNRFLKASCIKKYPLSSLKVIIYGGAIMNKKVQEKLKYILPHIQILQGYGMTETGGPITLPQSQHKNGSNGVVAKNTQIKIVDPENGKIFESNQPGEIWVKSATIMTGYYKNPEATKSTIDEEGWLHTGDIGYIDEDGELFIIDRIKELIKYRGQQISPGEIEGVLISHPAVLEAAIIGVPHALDNEHPLAYVSKKPGIEVTEQELIDFVAENMEDRCKLRAGVIFLDSFPYTGSGKISKKRFKRND
ncbi:PREDICTED: 4-coumarate--CoA ligase 1-like [Atta cephalotes]|uniref:Luciferin 4-monooxygenase n=1 Tax=Atta cephalotes TaxID=12957 RepID=A0A158NQ87_ATTCE|nr:PREDICTED: 4-coumarate--CoA ligase 1-like [Atta cephalotes]